MPSTLRKILIVPDTHRPYHDKRAWALMLKAARGFRPDVVVVLGDFADFYAVSSHRKDPNRTRFLDREVADVLVGLDELDKLVKEKIFIAGNHEYRLERYLQDRAPELFNMVRIPDLFQLRARGWQYVPYKDDTRLGHLHMTHDLDNAGRYSVFRCLDTYQASNATGHTHRLAYVVEGTATGEHKVSAQFGWLGDVRRVDYKHKAKANKDWALGFGVGYLDERTGIVYLVPIPIVRYTCVVEGVLYSQRGAK